MAETRERSGLFKFFYVILRVITFPIYAVVFVLSHPIFVLAILLVGTCVVIYYPLKEGVELADVPDWYKAKYTQAKLEVVSKAVESGNDGLIPDSMVKDVQQMKKKLVVDAEEAARVKGENYNDKVSRDYAAEDKKNELKKRGGFNKAKSAKEELLSQEEQELVETVLTTVESDDEPEGEIVGVGGLADILKKKAEADALKKQQEAALTAANEAAAKEAAAKKAAEEVKYQEQVAIQSADEVPTPAVQKKAAQPAADDDISDDDLDLF